MIKVNVDILPFGREEKRSTIAEIEIYNTADNKLRPEYGNYKYSVSHMGKTKTGYIANFKRDLGALELLKLVINDID